MAIMLNVRGAEYARHMIQQGNFDLDGDWESNKPTAQDEDEFLANRSFEEYGNWFLGFNPDADPESKERYEFPIGNFKKIFHSGIVAAELRAAEYDHEKIRKVTHELLDMMPK